ncbi:uncharacterized protein LOC141611852 [Silene latifolia]|uniref:uncharacterized protein LOC141611852 n=1 Tax=Silene latifolia TaxID=37657 RepID=UPI003D771653
MVEDSKDAEKEPPQQQQQLQVQQQHYTRKPSVNEDFTRTIAKIAVAQICENEGFQGFQQSALEALSDVAIRYLKELGKASNLYCNLAGRSECNVFDLIQGLEDLGFVQGFPGASDVHRSLPNSGVVKEIQQYVNFVENVPFAFHLPRFQVSKQFNSPSTFLQFGDKDKPLAEHIPPWLPPFPLGENQTDGFPAEHVDGPKVDEAVELVKDEQRDLHLVRNDRIEAKVNPFLAPPLRYGDKEVSFVEPPSIFFLRNHGSMMGTYGEMTENEGLPKELCEIEASKNTLRSDERPPVRFQFSKAKKSPTSSDISGLIKRNQNPSGFFRIEEGEDDKKSWAHECLKVSSEIQQLDGQ